MGQNPYVGFDTETDPGGTTPAEHRRGRHRQARAGLPWWVHALTLTAAAAVIYTAIDGDPIRAWIYFAAGWIALDLIERLVDHGAPRC